jgi:hypothetical protein
MDRTPVPCKIEQVIGLRYFHGHEFSEAQAERCRLPAKNADEFTKRRLFVLAVQYEKRVIAAEPSAATRILKTPPNTKEAPAQV